MGSIHFFYEDVPFTLESPSVTQHWIESIISDHDSTVEAINFIFCSDDYLLNINRSYLEHDYYTDIITFDNREPGDVAIESDIFISIDRIQDNAGDMNISFDRELHRVVIHGILHLLGWNDKTDDQKRVMREKEEACLSLHPNYH